MLVLKEHTIVDRKIGYSFFLEYPRKNPLIPYYNAIFILLILFLGM